MLRGAEHHDAARCRGDGFTRGFLPADHYNDHMGIRVTATEAKARILSLLDDVAAGEEVEITRHGRTVARIVPAVGPHALKASLAGKAMTAATEDDLFSTGETWELA
jgi:prevent-host-death family protein